MPFVIETAEDEQLFREYTTHRDEVRAVMGQGVYPNLVKALSTFAAFDAALANGLSDPDLLEYHASTMQTVAPHIAQLRQLAQGMTQIMVAIETAQPGAFGIVVPVVPPEEPIAGTLEVSTTGKVGLGYTTTPQTELHIETEKPQ
jgi:hypothetical protein